MPHADLHAALEKTLTRCKAGTGAAELHGSLSGYLCAGGRAHVDDWLECLEITPGAAGATADAALREAFEHAQTQFRSNPAQVEPVLPVAASPAAERAQALVEWCRGFLGGFGLGGFAASARLPAQGEEILADFGMIAATQLEADADDERAFGDVHAFVCTAVALLHRHVCEARGAAQRSLH